MIPDEGMPVHPAETGPDTQTAKLNSGGDAIFAMNAAKADEDRSAAEKFREQALAQLQRLGVATLVGDVPDDAPVLVAALAKVQGATGLSPIKETVTVANQGGTWTFDVYHYAKFLSPGVRYSANEALLALSPDTVIGALRAGGFIQ